MPEPIIADPNNPNPTAPDATKPNNGNSDSGQIDLKNLSEEQLAQVYENPNLFKHPRFKELSDAKKERDALKAQADEAEKTRLKEEGKWKELAEKAENEKNQVLTQLQQTKVDSTIERLANKAGVVDSEAVLKLIDRSTISVDPTTGEVKGASEAVTKLLEDKKYLAGNGNNINIGNPTNPGNANTSLKRFKMSQTQDAKFFKDNEADILASMRAGLVENDLTT